MPETVFEAVLRVAKANGVQDQHPNQQDHTFIYSLVKALSTCSAEEWETLPVEAHEWYNEIAKMTRSGVTDKEFPKPEGFISASVPVVVKQEAPVKVQVEKPAVVNVTKAKKEAVPEQKERVKRNKNSGILDAIRKTIILNPSLNAKQVHEIVKQTFPEASSAIVAVNTGDVKRVVALVQELGYWREPVNVAEKKTA